MRLERPFVFHMAGVTLALHLLSSSASGQNASPARPADPLVPSAPHERMTFFEGTWAMEPGAYFKSGAPPSSAHEETCAWLAGGRRHMVCRSWRERPGDGVRREAIYILSYDEHDAAYIAHFAFAGGATLTYRGRVEDDRWVMDMQPTPLLPPNDRFRTTITKLPSGLRFIEEHSVGGGPWTVTEDYRYRRVR